MKNVRTRTRKRRIAVVMMVVGAAFVVMAGTQATGSGAAVQPFVDQPGPVTINVTNAGVHVNIAGSDVTIGPFSGTLTGTVDADGFMSFPKSGISFSSFDQTITVPAHITPVASNNWTGTIAPDDGTISLAGGFSTRFTVVSGSIVIPDCKVGPSNITPQATNYSESDGSASMDTGQYQIPEVPTPTTGCGDLETAINGTLGLPGVGSLSFDAVVDPILTGTGPPPPTTTTFPTPPTTAPVATTVPGGGGSGGTVAPSASGGSESLPRTGGTSGPIAAVGLAMLGAGGLMLLSRRRDRVE